MKPEELKFGHLALQKGLVDGLDPEPAPSGDAVPASIGGFEIRGTLGQGAMGRVYRAYHPGLRRDVALKVLREEEGGKHLERLMVEAQAAGRLSHPNIVAVHDARREGTGGFIVMQLIEGRTLEELLLRGEIPLRDGIALLEKVARAVAYAHEKGVIHRDLKPTNILVDAGGEPHLADFGLARLTERETQLTRSGTSIGTPAYMPPEQVRGAVREIGRHSDVYSLGVVLYRMLAGRVPFDGSTLGEVYDQILRTEPLPPRRRNPSCPRALETICLKALEKEPRRRYASAAALAEDLRRFLGGEPIDARPAGFGTKLWRRGLRHRWTLLPALVSAVVLAVGLAWLARRDRSREEALRLLETARPALEQATRAFYRADVDLVEALLRVDEASRPIEAAIRVAPDFAPAHLLLGRARDLKGDEPGAEASWRRAIELDPRLGPAHMQLARLLLMRSFTAGVIDPSESDRAQDCGREAGRELERATEAGSGVDDARDLEAVKAMAAYLRRDVDAVGAICRASIERMRGAEGVETFHLLLSLVVKGEEPLKAIDAALAIRPRFPRAWICRALVHSAMSEHGKAVDDCTEALRINPAFLDALMWRGREHQALGDNGAAGEDYTLALKIDPGRNAAWFNRGNARYQRGDLDGAIEDYAAALRLRPDWDAAHLYRGFSLQKKGDAAGAVAEFSETIRCNPDHARAWTQRANARMQLKDFRGAVADLEKARALPSDEPGLRAEIDSLLEEARRGVGKDY